MTPDAPLVDRLKQFGTNLESWRAEADRLRQTADEAIVAHRVDNYVLVDIEKSASVLYDEIDAFKVAVAEVAEKSPDAAGELAVVGEALHVLLLEITELGTRLYSLKSADVTGSEALQIEAD